MLHTYRMTLFKKRTYLDWASAAPVSAGAKAVFVQALAADGNPSAPHAEGRAAKDILEAARVAIARLAEAKADDVIFTSGATEANNLALSSFAGGHILYLPTAHASIIETIQSLDADAETIDLPNLKKQIKESTVLVTVDAVNGETGERINTRDVRRALDEVRKGIVLHVDASQLPLAESFELSRLGADLLTLDAQKVGGVRGIGALIRRHGVALSPIMHGGGQEQGLRPGTESPALAAAFAEALQEAKEKRNAFATRAGEARANLVATIKKDIPDMEVNERTESAPHILNLSFPNRDTDYAVALLDKEGFAVSTKSACEADAEGSRVVLALTNDAARAASTLRVSWGSSTSEKDMNRFAEALIRTIRFLDAHRL